MRWRSSRTRSTSRDGRHLIYEVWPKVIWVLRHLHLQNKGSSSKKYIWNESYAIYIYRSKTHHLWCCKAGDRCRTPYTSTEKGTSKKWIWKESYAIDNYTRTTPYGVGVGRHLQAASWWQVCSQNKAILRRVSNICDILWKLLRLFLKPRES